MMTKLDGGEPYKVGSGDKKPIKYKLREREDGQHLGGRLITNYWQVRVTDWKITEKQAEGELRNGTEKPREEVKELNIKMI